MFKELKENMTLTSPNRDNQQRYRKCKKEQNQDSEFNVQLPKKKNTFKKLNIGCELAGKSANLRTDQLKLYNLRKKGQNMKKMNRISETC